MPDLEKPITTQEDLDAAVQAAIGDRYGDYDALKANEQKYAGYDQKLSGLESENKQLKTAALRSKVAHEMGLPYELGQRLTGEKEEDIRKDAEALKKLVRPQTPGYPGFSNEPSPSGDSKTAALRGWARNLTKKD